MTQNLKTILMSAAVSLFVAAMGYFTIASFVGSTEAPGFRGPTIITQKPQVVEKYVPQTTEEQIIVDIVKKSQGAVVSVVATKDLPVLEQYYVDPFQQFGLPQDLFGGGTGMQIPQYRQNGTQPQQVSAGTGFIISSDGLILTNKHVVSDTGADFTVLTNDGKKYPATVLATDPVQDIALLKIDEKNLPVLELGDSDSIASGQTVIAIGNALGQFQNTVSVGVISGLQRSITAQDPGTGSESLENLIQTDAAINPGNSGGPLINLDGKVIGISTAITEQAQNIGFALPINKAKKDVSTVKQGGTITYPFLGVRYVLIDPDLAKQNNLPVDYGALVVRGQAQTDLAVTPGSPADLVGIVENDIILEIDGKKITATNSLSNVIQAHNVGDTVTLTVLHKGAQKTVKVTLVERKQ